jgi:Mg2+ and Co2+ transporter CorA
MASTGDSAFTVGPEVEVSVPEALPVEEGKADRSIRTFYRLQEGRLLSCEPNEAQIIAYVSPTIDDEAELQELYKIDYHTLQSSLDPDELSRLEIEPDHAAIIFKRPKSFCADDNFLLKLTSTGIFVYPKHLVIVMADDASIFEGRVPFPVKSIHDVILRLLYQATMHFEGHLKAINMLADSLETAHQHLSGKQVSPQHVRARKEPRLYSQLDQLERLAPGKNEVNGREAWLRQRSSRNSRRSHHRESAV